MAVYVGTPGDRQRAVYGVASVFVLVLMAMLTAGMLFALAQLVTSGSTSGLIFVYAIPAMVGLGAAMGGLRSARRKAGLERAVDAELRKLPDSYLVFCGRPWTGETAPRAPSDAKAYSPEGWTLTDSGGRPLGSLSPDRVLLGPDGALLVAVRGGLRSEALVAERGAVREHSLQLKAFLKNVSLCRDAPEESFSVRTFLCDASGGVFYDMSAGTSRPLCDIARTISSVPAVLPADHVRAMAVALAGCYPDADRTRALAGLEGLRT